jgi:hypothetical protein
VFDFQVVDLFQHEMIETCEGAYPVLFDHNGDGLMDILISNYGCFAPGGFYSSKLTLLLNTGTSTQPAFARVTDDYELLSTLGLGQALHPAFHDLDGDGDQDMLLGELQGKLFKFINTPSGGVANFSSTFTVVNNDLGVNIDVGQFSKPYFFDVDGDSKTDLLVGERNGNINYYRNTGTSASPVWHLENDTLGNVVVKEWWNVTGYSVPLMFINDDGDRELLVGSESGWIWDFGNIDGNVNGTFTLLDSMWQGIKEGSHSSLVLYDFNGDGARDVVTGNYRGGLGHWRNDFNVSTHSGDGLSPEQLFSLVPNPTAGATELVVSLPLSSTTELTAFDATGRRVLQRAVRDRRTTVDTGRWSEGVYTLRLSDQGRSWSQRLVIVR